MEKLRVGGKSCWWEKTVTRTWHTHQTTFDHGIKDLSFLVCAYIGRVRAHEGRDSTSAKWTGKPSNRGDMHKHAREHKPWRNSATVPDLLSQPSLRRQPRTFIALHIATRTSENVERVSLYLKPFLFLFYQRPFFSSLSLTLRFFPLPFFLMASSLFPHSPPPLPLMKAFISEMLAKEEAWEGNDRLCFEEDVRWKVCSCHPDTGDKQELLPCACGQAANFHSLQSRLQFPWTVMKSFGSIPTAPQFNRLGKQNSWKSLSNVRPGPRSRHLEVHLSEERVHVEPRFTKHAALRDLCSASRSSLHSTDAGRDP